ncbi:hypothetical protein HNR46_002062 [Haloferula luteola]|uniref:Uncharacterized protein n=1 Tax=Haloferula luteola TaxID=595692 RepID=A0A840V2X0_9BACT|nr:hypothetical protein [Haloferula luteola]MBB5351823.1 hypothetical protein [Haloferula luteola]
MINFQHVDSQSADEALGSILDELPVPDDASLEPGSYMTFGVAGFSLGELGKLLDGLLMQYFKAEEISCSVEKI